MSGGYVQNGEEIRLEQGGRLLVASGGTIKIDGGTLEGAISELTVSESSGAAGEATLVNGSVTVSTSKIRSDSIVLLSVKSALGIAGRLSVENRVSVTSFDIVSDSADDASTVSWLIVKPE